MAGVRLQGEWKLLNSQEYVQMIYEAFSNDGQAIEQWDWDINGTWDTTRYTDWQKELIGGVAKYLDVQSSISGGTNKTQFLVGAGFHKETTVVPGNMGDRKGSLHFNLANISPNGRLKFQLSGRYMVDENNLIGQDLTSVAMQLPPVAPPIYNSDGTLNLWAPDANGNSTWQNPLLFLLNKYVQKTNNLIGNAEISYGIGGGFDFKTNFGYNKLHQKGTQILPLASILPEFRSFRERLSYFSNSDITTWIVEPQLTYKKSIGKASIQVLVGSSIQETNNSSEYIQCSGFTSDLLMENAQCRKNDLCS